MYEKMKHQLFHTIFADVLLPATYILFKQQEETKVGIKFIAKQSTDFLTVINPSKPYPLTEKD